MKIANYNVQLSAASERTEFYAKSESVDFWMGAANAQGEAEEQPAVLLDLGKPQEQPVTYTPSTASSKRVRGPEPNENDETLITALQRMIEMLTGKRMRFTRFDPEKFFGEGGMSAAGAGEGGGWGMVVQSSEQYYESESMSFSGGGVVQTADGKTISFSMDLSMSREFAATNSTTLRLGNANMTDPLVINFNAPAAGLSSTKFSFDLDADGKSDQISSLLSGSGFLALDKNNDGVVNNGNELFGTTSGDGFADLAAYDSDGNQWIDENDPIFDKLRIWVRDENGSSRLFALGQKGIGAIYLGSAKTEYGFKDNANQAHGQLRSTGVFLHENGKAGTIQHVDLAI